MDGQWLAEGWTASTEVAGQVGPAGRWAELIQAGEAFHPSLRDRPRPPQLALRTDRWAEADRVAWGEQAAEPLPAIAPLLDRLLSHRRPVRRPSQLIHGDLAGNVLFAERAQPAVIDFSPYWRPLEYATALIFVDGLLWWDGGSELLSLAPPEPAFGQFLLRALIFRLMALDGRVRQVGPAALNELAAFAATADRLPIE